jgi:CO/xanthine dehydrogenase Mo-binding subunit
MGGAAVRKAAAEVKQKIFAAAAEQLHATIEVLETSDGKIYLKGAPEKSITFDEIREKWGPIIATASFEPSLKYVIGSSPVDPETGQGDPFQTYVYATQIADVEVDTETGIVKVLKIVAAHDVGKAINPALVKGQIAGGIGFGVGQAIMEDMAIVKGINQNPNLRDYLVPTSVDMPEVQMILVEENDPSGPFGAKGVGEPACLPTTPAIINAIYNAVGIRIRDLPATPDKILAALKKKN